MLLMIILKMLTNIHSWTVMSQILTCSLFYFKKIYIIVKSNLITFSVSFLFLYFLFISCFLFFVLVGSGKLTFYWPSSNHRVTVTGTSLPLSIHTLPCPSTNQPPCFTCHWPQRQTAQNKVCRKYG